MPEQTYVAVAYPRFNFFYWTVRLPDLLDNPEIQDDRASNVDNGENREQVQKACQELVDGLEERGMRIPNPKFVRYDEFSSSYVGDATYHKITIRYKNQYEPQPVENKN